MPHLHIVICSDPSIARETRFIVWTVAWQQLGPEGQARRGTSDEGEWATSNGRYDLPTLDRALFVMCDRARDFLDRI